MYPEIITNRSILKISGNDTDSFLQSLVTNDISHAKDNLVYAALLSPKGKYLFDFFISSYPGGYLIDVSSDQAYKLIQRLNLYKLRADVNIEETNIKVGRGLELIPENALQDPRSHMLGWRVYDPIKTQSATIDWDKIRVENCIPETGIELIADETYILEANFEILSGVDFRKGCYVGQEVTARMKHKTELKKGFVTVEISEVVPVGTTIMSNQKVAGIVFTQSKGKAIAYLRFDRVSNNMKANTADIMYHVQV
ncbi:folate-binding protein [Amylibacter sp.]|nr:folate-binding protein [Amylibacter sp.]MDC1243263.1 folate-binding protein [Amylibacter sp.]